MHTEGSIIFADTKVFDKRRQVRERWRWQTAKELLDLAQREPSSSSISAIFMPFEYGQPTRAISLNVELLHNLVFDDETTVENTVTRVVNANPGVEARRFRDICSNACRSYTELPRSCWLIWSLQGTGWLNARSTWQGTRWLTTSPTKSDGHRSKPSFEPSRSAYSKVLQPKNCVQCYVGPLGPHHGQHLENVAGHQSRGTHAGAPSAILLLTF